MKAAKPAAPETPSVNDIIPTSTPNCEAVDDAGGGMTVMVRVAPDIAKRLRLRAGTMPMDRYLWENILYRALMDSVY